MNRRSFFSALAGTAGALWLPYEPKRIYSFGEDVGRVHAPGEIRSIVINGIEFPVALATAFFDSSLVREFRVTDVNGA